MSSHAEAPEPQRLARLPLPAQWLLLLALSVCLAALLEAVRLPAALLIGPMIAAIVAGTNGAAVRVPLLAFAGAQAVVGCLIAASISPGIFSSFLNDWPLFAGAVAATIAASTFMGWMISARKILPGTTGVWGSAPGAATVMVLMAGSFGADARLVAFMQYLRVLFVALAAALVARLWVDTSGAVQPGIDWFPPLDWMAFGTTVLVSVAGALGGFFLRLPSPYFVGTMILGSVLHLGFGLPLQIPEWLLAISYAVIGWAVGLNFTPTIVRHALRALPQVVASIVVLITVCGGIAWLLHRFAGIDPLTAYLATSPGGMDSIAIIAAASKSVDISFVMALQTARFLFVLLLGPSLAKLVARLVRE